jgi:hypothetical protein
MESTNAQKPAKQAKKSSSSAIRVSNETRKRLLADLAKINKKAQGKRIKIDALLGVLLPKLTAKDVLELQEASLSGRDRLEQNFKTYCAKFGAITMDEFLALISRETMPQILKGDAANSESENAT